MNSTQRTDYQRQRPSRSTPDTRPQITWRDPTTGETTLTLTIAGSAEDLVITGIPQILRTRDGAAPVSCDVVGDTILLTYPSPHETEDEWVVPQNDPALANRWGGRLAPGWITPARPASPIIATAAAINGADVQITLTSAEPAMIQYAGPQVYSEQYGRFADTIAFASPYLTLSWSDPPGPLEGGWHVTFEEVAPTIINTRGGWLAPFSLIQQGGGP